MTGLSCYHGVPSLQMGEALVWLHGMQPEGDRVDRSR